MPDCPSLTPTDSDRLGIFARIRLENLVRVIFRKKSCQGPRNEDKEEKKKSSVAALRRNTQQEIG